jgi:hypothetical protein
VGGGPQPVGGRPVVAFVHIQKTAGTSMKFILKHSFGLSHCDVNPLNPAPGSPFARADLDFVRRVYPGLRSISGHEIVEPTRHLGDAVMPYTMLRDPVARMISHFQDKNVRGRAALALDDFLADPAQHDFQVRKIAGGPDLEKAKRLLEARYFFVGLTERFAASLRLFAAVCPYPVDLRYRRQNKAGDDRISRRLRDDEDAMARIRAANRLDEALYDYVAKTLLPARLATAGGADERPLPSYERTLPPLRFVLSRVYHRGVYRTALKRARRRRCA